MDCVVVPTYNRPEFLENCILAIREANADIPIFLFPDRGTAKDVELHAIVKKHVGVYPKWVPNHGYHGNSYNALEALRWAWNGHFEKIFYVEDDVMVHRDFFDWHYEMHNEWPDLFASMAWVFNRFSPMTDEPLFQPWYYAIGTCFTFNKLAKIVEHASPLYYEDMAGYIEKNFRKSKLNSPFGIQHYEQDGLIQRILDADKSQTVSSGIAKCTHLGCIGYNRGWSRSEEFFAGCKTMAQRVERVAEFYRDPWWRADVFGRDIVQREIGRERPQRDLHYTVTLPGGWESEFVSELTTPHLPRRINSVLLPRDARIVLSS
jgi:hypothetical protein